MHLLDFRNRHFLVLDALFLCLTPLLALVLRLDRFTISPSYVNSILVYTALALVIRLAVFHFFGLYRRFWRYASIDDMVQIITAVLLSTALIIAIVIPLLVVIPLSLPRSLYFIDALLVLMLVGGSRFLVRLSAQRKRLKPNGKTRHALIVGAGDAGSLLLREIQNNPQLNLIPIGFVDDDPRKRHLQIHGLPVLGGQADLPTILSEYGVQQVIIAMPTAPGSTIRTIATTCEKMGVQTKTLPGIYELVDGNVTVNQLRKVQIEDLLRREPVQTEIAAVQELLTGRRVLITGGGGSIGSELCRQVLRCQPAELVLLGHGENSIFEIHNELQWLNQGEVKLTAVIADTRFPDHIMTLLQQHKPEIVFHAAAHKHVPLMEQNPAEAITNNVLGTRNLLRAAVATGVAHFVMISTDKAVNPTSVMGASKRAAELLVHQAARQSGRPYVAVRFGNVLGSRGSVVLTFQKQIAAGGPVTVTDPEMTRFFMTIPEAVQLVLQAAVLGRGGQVFVLDMGQPVKILDLARDLIELSGLKVGQDIAIEFSGLRPGEKLYEELFIPGEQYERTAHQKIFIAANASAFVPADLDESLKILEAAANRQDGLAIRRGLQALIPEYTPPPLADSSTAAKRPAPHPTQKQPNRLPEVGDTRRVMQPAQSQ
jgi:FlaA1/EpsC-like NDP-sugar epimerase